MNKTNFLRKTSLNKEITFSRKVKSKSKIRMDRRANMLTEHTLKVIIAVMSLLLLLYLLFSLYSSFTGKQNFKRAEATLENLNEKMIDASNSGKKQSIPLLEPNGWVLVSYGAGEKPDKCTDNCICLCEDEKVGRWKWFLADNQIEKCNIRGECKNFEEKINEFKIKLRKDVEVEFDDGWYTIVGVEDEDE